MIGGASAGTGDTYTPTFMTVNPDGTIGYDFSGVIHAEGLDLPSSPGGVPNVRNKVRWLRDSDGAVVADIWGGNTDEGVLSLNARNVGAGTRTELRLTEPSGAGGLPGGVSFNMAGSGFTLLDENGLSSFLQLDTARKSIIGRTDVTWAGASRFSGVTSVNHGLGGTPTRVLATILPGVPQGDIVVCMAGATATQLTFQGAFQSFVPGAGSMTVSYLAVV